MFMDGDREMYNALTEYLTLLYKKNEAWLVALYQKNPERGREVINKVAFETVIGRNYVHVIRNDGGSRCSHSWVVLKDTKKFKRGTILKSATWKAPATNFGRGDIFEPKTYLERADWTGIG